MGRVSVVPDLPVELWLEILAYLPRSALQRMVGVNRILFELALDDLYEEIRFISDDKAMLKTFEQMQFAGITKRVRRLLIQPAFLPALDEPTPGPLQSKLPSRWRFRSLVRTKSPPVVPVPTSNADEEKSRNRVLQAATAALRRCPNLHEVAIVVHDHALTPSFSTFIHSLWNSDSLGPNLRSLSISTTPANLPRLLPPLVYCYKSLANLEEITLNITFSRVDLTSLSSRLATHALKSFFSALKDKLTAISLSSSSMDLIETVVGSVQSFPKLRKLEIFTTFMLKGGPSLEILSKFIAKHANILEHLKINSGPSHRTSYGAIDVTYSRWINPTEDESGPSAFTGVVFPYLKTLDMGLRERSQVAQYASYGTIHPRVLPNPSLFAPNITSLILTDVRLSFHRISVLVEDLSRGRDGGSILEQLNIAAATLSPPLFDILASKLPRLKRLTIDFMMISDREESPNNVQVSHFSEFMGARRYPRWKLQYLRLTMIDHSCGASHPKHMPMSTVAKSLPGGVELDCSYTCFCHSAFAA